MNNYIVVATSLSSDISSSEILELYRYRRQIELFFKRAKSLLQLGNLPNKKEENILAWLDGKMLCALFVELIQSKVIFPPKEHFESQKSQYLARVQTFMPYFGEKPLFF